MIDLRDLYITTLHSFEEDEQDLLIDKEYGKHFKSFEAFLESFKQVQPKQSLANPIACNGWQCFVVIDNRLHGHICVEGKVAHKYFKCLSKRYNSDRIKLPKYCTQVIPHPDFKFGNIKFISDYITYRWAVYDVRHTTLTRTAQSIASHVQQPYHPDHTQSHPQALTKRVSIALVEQEAHLPRTRHRMVGECPCEHPGIWLRYLQSVLSGGKR